MPGFILQEDNSFILQEDGSSKLLLDYKPLVQSASGNNTSTTALAIPLANTTTGNMIIVAINVNQTTDRISSVSDGTNTFSKITAISGLIGGGAASYLTFWYAYNITGLTTPTITITKSATAGIEAVVLEYQGVTTTDPLDKSSRSTATATPVVSGSTATLTQADELVVGFGGDDWGTGITYTLGSGFGNLVQKTATAGTIATQDKLVSATTAVSSSMAIDQTTDNAGAVATFFNQVPVSSQSITPTGISSGAVLGSPTLAPGSVGIAASGIASVSALGAPTVGSTYPITSTGIASTSALGVPTASPGAVAITPTGIGSSSALGTPTLTPGAVNISTTGISSGSALGTPTVGSTYNITATGISATSSLGSPTLSPGAVSITPTGISSTASIGSATSGSVYNVSTASISVTTAIGSPTASPGAVSIPETSITSTATIGAPSASPGAVNISPTAVSSGSTLGSPTVSAPAGNQTITPSALATTLAIGSVALSATFNLSVTSIASSASLGSPSIGSVYSISATGLSSTAGLGSPTVSPGVVSLSPSGLGPNTQFGAVTLSGGTPVVQDRLAKLVDGGVTARVANVSQKVIVTGDGGLAVKVGNRYLQL